MPASRARVGVIFFTVLIDLIGFGIVMPILPFYAQRFGASGLAYGVVLAVYSFMQFVATALLGKLSDRIGRRPVLLATMLFNAVGYTLFAFAGSYWVLFLSRVVSGFAGGNISSAQPSASGSAPAPQWGDWRTIISDTRRPDSSPSACRSRISFPPTSFCRNH